MKDIKIVYIPTGEVRPPKTGEWFKNDRNCFEQAMFDFNSIKLPIYTMEVEEIEKEQTVMDEKTREIEEIKEAFRLARERIVELEFLLSGKEESIACLKKQSSLEIAHSQQAEKKIEELQREVNVMIQEQVDNNRLYELCDEKDARIKELKSELRKWMSPHEDEDLQFLKEQSDQSALSAKQAYINGLECKVKQQEKKIEELEKRLKVLTYDCP
jgi:hypothetical protein